MESQLILLMYSKYSSLSKSIMDIIQKSGIDFTTQFGLQYLCIDNEKIRKRIIDNEQIQVTSVPCLLLIYPDGGIEKYDGKHAFEWVESILSKYSPQQEPLQQQQPQPQPQPQPQQPSQEELEKQQIIDKKRDDLRKLNNIREENKRNYEEGLDKQKPKKNRRRLIKKHEDTDSGEDDNKPFATTSIDDLPSDEDDDFISDRYRRKKPIGRIRTNEGNYEEDEELFKGATPDMRKSKKSAIKGDNHTGNDAKSKKSVDLMTKAKEMAKGREETEPPLGHPKRQMP
jgi:hypothetical protein